MTAAELRDAERLIDVLRPRLETRRTRRTSSTRTAASWRRGRCSGATWRPAATSSTGSGGAAVRRPRTIVVLCDVSGSMERHARLLLRFVQALRRARACAPRRSSSGRASPGSPGSLRGRDPRPGDPPGRETVTDWSGGTRIGESLRTFNLRWARRVLRSSSGVVIVVSDGWDRGDPALVGARDGPPPAELPPPDLAEPAAPAPTATSRSPAGMAAAYPFDRRLPADPRPGLARAARRACCPTAPTRREAARRARGFGGDGRPLGGPGAARRERPARGRAELRPPSRSTAATARRRAAAARRLTTGEPSRRGPAYPVAMEAAPMKELLGTSSAAGGPTGSTLGPRGRRPDVRLRAASGGRDPGRRRRDGRLAGSVSGGCVEGAAFEEIERARRDGVEPGDPLRDQRRAGLGRGARLRRHDRRPRRARASGPRSSRPAADTVAAGRWSSRCPPTRPARPSGRTSPGPGRRRRRRSSSPRTGR